jgi:hypothetical protein
MRVNCHLRRIGQKARYPSQRGHKGSRPLGDMTSARPIQRQPAANTVFKRCLRLFRSPPLYCVPQDYGQRSISAPSQASRQARCGRCHSSLPLSRSVRDRRALSQLRGHPRALPGVKGPQSRGLDTQKVPHELSTSRKASKTRKQPHIPILLYLLSTRAKWNLCKMQERRFDGRATCKRSRIWLMPISA